MKKKDIPAALYYSWLKQKWIADIKFCGWCILMSPYLLIALFGMALLACGELILSTKNIIPDRFFISENFRDKQQQCIQDLRAYERLTK